MRHSIDDLGTLGAWARWARAVRAETDPSGPFSGVTALAFGDAAAVPGWETFRPADLNVATVDAQDLPASMADLLAYGAVSADAAVDSGADLVVPVIATASGETHVTAATAVVVLAGAEPVWVLGFDRHPTPTAVKNPHDTCYLTDAEWITRCRRVRDLAWRTRGLHADPLLAELDDPPFTVIVGALLQLAERRTPVLLDGGIAAAAALAAARMNPTARETWYAPQRHGDAMERYALDALALDPIAPLGIRSGHGIGALALVPLLQAALAE